MKWLFLLQDNTHKLHLQSKLEHSCYAWTQVFAWPFRRIMGLAVLSSGAMITRMLAFMLDIHTFVCNYSSVARTPTLASSYFPVFFDLTRTWLLRLNFVPFSFRKCFRLGNNVFFHMSKKYTQHVLIHLLHFHLMVIWRVECCRELWRRRVQYTIPWLVVFTCLYLGHSIHCFCVFINRPNMLWFLVIICLMCTMLIFKLYQVY